MLFNKSKAAPHAKRKKSSDWDQRWDDKWGKGYDKKWDNQYPDPEQEEAPDQETGELRTSRPYPIRTVQGLLLILPMMIGIFFLILGVVGEIMLLIFRNRFGDRLTSLILICLLILIVGIILTLIGKKMTSYYQRFFKYLEKIGDRTCVDLEELVLKKSSGLNQVKKDLRQMIRADYFPEGHLDEEKHILYLTDQAYQEAERQ